MFWKKQSKPIGLFGGICLDNYTKIPKPYDDFISIGRGVMIKSGTILCGEGFRFTRTNGTLTFNRHTKGLIIGDDVWIGSNCTLDRGRWRDTAVNRGSKLDNFVHVGHNVIIGTDCIIGTGVKLLGSVEVGDKTEIWSNAVIHQGVKIGNNCTIGANSYVRHNVPDNHTVYGTGKYQVIKSKIKSKDENIKSKKERGGSKKIEVSDLEFND